MNFTVEKSSPISRFLLYLGKKNCPNISNHTKVEKSPNLITLTYDLPTFSLNALSYFFLLGPAFGPVVDVNAISTTCWQKND
jgi:hypothetical protein